MLAPAHFRNVDQSFNTGSYFYKSSVVSDHHHFSFYLITDLHIRTQVIPRMRSKLLQSKCDAFFLVVEIENHHVDLLIEFHDLFRVADASPAEVGDVYQS